MYVEYICTTLCHSGVMERVVAMILDSCGLGQFDHWSSCIMYSNKFKRSMFVFGEGAACSRQGFKVVFFSC